MEKIVSRETKILDDYLDSITVSDKIIKNKGRVYSINGNDYPSVTTVLKNTSDQSFLIEWRKKVGEEEADRISKEATERGSAMHLLVENHFNGIDIDKNSVGYPLFCQLERILVSIKPIGIEVPLYSDNLKVAGRTDLIGFDSDNELCIFDWKTSRKFKKREWIDDYFIQSCLYSMMLLETTGLTTKKINVIIAVDGGKPLYYSEKTSKFFKEAITRVRSYHDKQKLE